MFATGSPMMERQEVGPRRGAEGALDDAGVPRAEVQKINELSGHADQSELLTWMKPMVGTLRKVFLVHGEPMQQKALAAAIRERYGLEVGSPGLGETHQLE